MASETPSAFERWLRIAGIALTLLGVLAGLYQFTRTQAIEAARPFLERKLRWCEEAVELASGIAVHGRASTTQSAPSSVAVARVDRFWTLYWGVMGMVENAEITAAMIAFGRGLESGAAASDRTLALALAHACRSEMARDWSPAWRR